MVSRHGALRGTPTASIQTGWSRTFQEVPALRVNHSGSFKNGKEGTEKGQEASKRYQCGGSNSRVTLISASGWGGLGVWGGAGGRGGFKKGGGGGRRGGGGGGGGVEE